MALATEGHAVCRDATRPRRAREQASRPGLRSRGRANNPRTRNRRARASRGTPVNLRAHRWSAPGIEPSFVFFFQDGRLAKPPFSYTFSCRPALFVPPAARDVCRACAAPRARARTLEALFSYHHRRWAFVWLRTTMNYQYANGGTLTPAGASSTLYKEGGVPRFTASASFAIIQIGGFVEAGDTAASTGVMVALGELAPNGARRDADARSRRSAAPPGASCSRPWTPSRPRCRCRRGGAVLAERQGESRRRRRAVRRRRRQLRGS